MWLIWCPTLFERRFLWIHAVFDERALRAIHDPGRPEWCPHHRRTQVGTGVWVVQRDVERVVDDGAIALDANVSADRLRNAEQQQCLIEEVWSQVEPDP